MYEISSLSSCRKYLYSCKLRTFYLPVQKFETSYSAQGTLLKQQFWWIRWSQEVREMPASDIIVSSTQTTKCLTQITKHLVYKYPADRWVQCFQTRFNYSYMCFVVFVFPSTSSWLKAHVIQMFLFDISHVASAFDGCVVYMKLCKYINLYKSFFTMKGHHEAMAYFFEITASIFILLHM